MAGVIGQHGHMCINMPKLPSRNGQYGQEASVAKQNAYKHTDCIITAICLVLNIEPDLLWRVPHVKRRQHYKVQRQLRYIRDKLRARGQTGLSDFIANRRWYICSYMNELKYIKQLYE
jgi:hypothetical protein